MDAAAGFGHAGEQAVGGRLELDRLAGRVGDAGQRAVGVEGEGGALAVGADDRDGAAGGVALDGRDVAVGVGHRGQAAGRVVGEPVEVRPGQGVEGAEVPARGVEDEELAAGPGGDEDVAERGPRRGGAYSQDASPLIRDIEVAIGSQGDSGRQPELRPRGRAARPLEPGAYVPATVVMIPSGPTRRTTLLPLSAM